MKLEHPIDSKLQLHSADAIRRYIKGDQGEMTLVGPAGTAHTYRFARPREASEFPPDIRFVYVLHEGKQFYIGMIEDGKFRRTAHSRFNDDSECVKGARYIMKLATDRNLIVTTKMRIYSTGKCARCGKELTGEKSIQKGYGRTCWQAHLLRQEIEEQLYDQHRSATVQ